MPGIVGYDDQIPAATLTATTALATLPAANVYDIAVGRPCRFNAVTGTFRAVLAAPTSLRWFVIVSNLRAADSITIDIASGSDPTVGDVWDAAAPSITTDPDYGYTFVLLNAATTVGSLEITIDATGHPAGYVDLYAVTAMRAMEVLYEPGYAQRLRSGSINRYAPESGARQRRRRPALREDAFANRFMTASDIALIREIRRSHDTTERVAWCPDPTASDAAQTTYLGHLSELGEITVPDIVFDSAGLMRAYAWQIQEDK